MRRRVLILGVLLLAACGRRDAKPVEDLSGGRDLSRFVLTSLAGTRNGDRLDVRALFGNGESGEFRVELRFTVGVPTRLQSGTWSGPGGGGGVRERSVTFLGGQSGPPSVGGRFDLLGPEGGARYRVTIPVQELRNRL